MRASSSRSASLALRRRLSNDDGHVPTKMSVSMQLELTTSAATARTRRDVENASYMKANAKLQNSVTDTVPGVDD